MKRKILDGQKKNRPTKKQNKWNDPFRRWKISHLYGAKNKQESWDIYKYRQTWTKIRG